MNPTLLGGKKNIWKTFKEDSRPKICHKTGRINKGLLEPRKSILKKRKTNITSLLKSSGHVEWSWHATRNHVSSIKSYFAELIG